MFVLVGVLVKVLGNVGDGVIVGDGVGVYVEVGLPVGEGEMVLLGVAVGVFTGGAKSQEIARKNISMFGSIGDQAIVLPALVPNETPPNDVPGALNRMRAGAPLIYFTTIQ